MTSKKIKGRGLGKGLEELFGNVEINSEDDSENNVIEKNDPDDNDENRILYIDINEIAPNAEQPRKVFNEEKINELADSIEKHGVIQPVIIKKTSLGYEIIAGERRWRAARKAKLNKVPCILKKLSEEENMILSIIENMQREDLNPIEEAEALEQMIEKYNLSQEDVSKTVGKSRPYISNSLRLLKLPMEVRLYIVEGKITNGHARALLGLNDEIKQIELADRITEENISVRDEGKIVKEQNENVKEIEIKKKTKEENPNLVIIETELSEKFGTKVKIKEKKGKGKIEIDFYTEEEFESIINKIK